MEGDVAAAVAAGSRRRGEVPWQSWDWRLREEEDHLRRRAALTCFHCGQPRAENVPLSYYEKFAMSSALIRFEVPLTIFRRMGWYNSCMKL
ncbi:unnamed protein product [Lampetra planeri]